MDEHALISDPEGLTQFTEQAFDSTSLLGVDTEFVRERTYNARLCLLQLAGNGSYGCLDPFELDDLEPVAAVFRDSSVTKIFHAARQDLEVLYQRLGFVVAPVFDTQIAAAMCGYGDQVGYAALVERVTGTALAKEETRTDWSRRPLSDAQIEYAVADVAHLHDLHEDLCDTLEQKGRLDWLIEENNALNDVALYSVDPEQVWQRVKGLGSLPAEGQHQVARLATWREREAQKRDLPREWVVRDRALVDLVKTAPSNADALGGIEDIGKRTRERYADVLLDMLAEPVQSDEPLVKSAGRPDREFNAMRKSMMDRLRKRAEDERIAPSLLANRDTVERFIRDPSDSPLLKGWRRELIGESLLEIRGTAT